MTQRFATLVLSAPALTTLQTGCGEKVVTYQADIKPIIDANSYPAMCPAAPATKRPACAWTV